MNEPIKVNYDVWKNELTIEGVRYSPEIFRFSANAKPGDIFRFVRRLDDTVTIESIGRANEDEPIVGQNSD